MTLVSSESATQINSNDNIMDEMISKATISIGNQHESTMSVSSTTGSGNDDENISCKEEKSPLNSCGIEDSSYNEKLVNNDDEIILVDVKELYQQDNDDKNIQLAKSEINCTDETFHNCNSEKLIPSNLEIGKLLPFQEIIKPLSNSEKIQDRICCDVDHSATEVASDLSCIQNGEISDGTTVDHNVTEVASDLSCLQNGEKLTSATIVSISDRDKKQEKILLDRALQAEEQIIQMRTCIRLLTNQIRQRQHEASGGINLHPYQNNYRRNCSQQIVDDFDITQNRSNVETSNISTVIHRTSLCNDNMTQQPAVSTSHNHMRDSEFPINPIIMSHIETKTSDIESNSLATNVCCEIDYDEAVVDGIHVSTVLPINTVNHREDRNRINIEDTRKMDNDFDDTVAYSCYNRERTETSGSCWSNTSSYHPSLATSNTNHSIAILVEDHERFLSALNDIKEHDNGRNTKSDDGFEPIISDHISTMTRRTTDSRLCSDLLALQNVVSMMQTHTDLSVQESQELYIDLCTSKKSVEQWKTRATRAEKQVAQLQEQYTKAYSKNQKLNEERKVLVHAYKALHAEKQKSLIDHIEDYVVNAITMHEYLLKCPHKSQTLSDKRSEHNVSNDQSHEEILQAVLSNSSIADVDEHLNDQLDAGLVIDGLPQTHVSYIGPSTESKGDKKIQYRSNPSSSTQTTLANPQMCEGDIDPTNRIIVSSSSRCPDNSIQTNSDNGFKSIGLGHIFNNINLIVQAVDPSYQKITSNDKETKTEISGKESLDYVGMTNPLTPLALALDKATDMNKTTKEEPITAPVPTCESNNNDSTKQDTGTAQQPVLRMAMRSNAWIQPKISPPSHNADQYNQKSLGSRFLNFINPSLGDENESATSSGNMPAYPAVMTTESIPTIQPLIRLHDLSDIGLDDNTAVTQAIHSSDEAKDKLQRLPDDSANNYNEKIHRFDVIDMHSTVVHEFGKELSDCESNSPASVLDNSRANGIQILKSLSIPVELLETQNPDTDST